MRFGVLWSFVVLALFFWALPARADQQSPGMQFVCAPKVNYFSASTLTFDDIAPGQLQRSPELTIMAVADLRQPYTCRWNGGTIQVRLTHYHSAQATGFCGGNEYGDLDISWNGASIAQIKEDPCGAYRHTVSLQDLNYRGPASFNQPRGDQPKGVNLYVEHCSSTDDHGGTFNCDTSYFDGRKKS
jgi:hypothetical protein